MILLTALIPGSNYSSECDYIIDSNNGSKYSNDSIGSNDSAVNMGMGAIVVLIVVTVNTVMV